MKTELSTAMLNGLQYYAQQEGAEKPRTQTTRALVVRGLLHEFLGLTAEGYAALGYQLPNDSTPTAEILDSGSQETMEMNEVIEAAPEVATEVCEVIEAAQQVSEVIEAAPEVSEVCEAAPEVNQVSEAATFTCASFPIYPAIVFKHPYYPPEQTEIATRKWRGPSIAVYWWVESICDAPVSGAQTIQLVATAVQENSVEFDLCPSDVSVAPEAHEVSALSSKLTTAIKDTLHENARNQNPSVGTGLHAGRRGAVYQHGIAENPRQHSQKRTATMGRKAHRTNPTRQENHVGLDWRFIAHRRTLLGACAHGLA
jgi:hypothetical protein